MHTMIQTPNVVKGNVVKGNRRRRRKEKEEKKKKKSGFFQPTFPWQGVKLHSNINTTLHAHTHTLTMETLVWYENRLSVYQFFVDAPFLAYPTKPHKIRMSTKKLIIAKVTEKAND